MAGATFRGTPTGTATGATLAGMPDSGIFEDDIFEDDIFQEEPHAATLQGTPDAARQQAFDGDTVATGWRLELAGTPVDADLLAPEVTLTDSLDTHLADARLTLLGSAWRLLHNLAPWTQRDEWRLYFITGPPGAEQEELVLRGHVLPPAEQDHANGLETRLQLGDASVLYDRFELCHEVPPFSGLTRGAVVRALASDAGVPTVDVPAGAPYDRPALFSNVKLFSVLWPFGEPEGWHWRWRPSDGALEAYTATVKLPPRAPDAVWTLDDVESVTLSSPDHPDSTLVVRGFASVVEDEDGTVTETRTTLVESVYAPKVATHQQDSSGTLVPTGFSQPPEELRVTLKLEETSTKRGSLLLSQRTREWGWFNPAAAKVRTQKSGEGDGPLDGFYWPAVSYVDGEGRHVANTTEDFVLTGDRLVTFSYDAEGTRTGDLEEVQAWHRKTHAVKNDVGGWHFNVPVGDDDQSYELLDASTYRIEGFGLAQRTTRAVTYNAQGASATESEDVETHYAPRAGLGTTDAEELYDGSAQVGTIAQLTKTQSTATVNTHTADGSLGGQIRAISAYRALRRAGGEFDFGEFESAQAREEFRTIGRETVQYNRLGERTFEEVHVDLEGIRHTRVLQGRSPLPRFTQSPWTRLVQEPVEFRLDDDGLAALFGSRTTTINHPHVQSPSEAETVARRRHLRETAFTATVRRAETTQRPGDTVQIEDPLLGLAHRGLVANRQRTRNALTGEATGIYALEVNL